MYDNVIFKQRNSWKLICESVVVVAAGRGGGGGGGGGNAVFSGSLHISQAMQHILQRKAHWI